MHPELAPATRQQTGTAFRGRRRSADMSCARAKTLSASHSYFHELPTATNQSDIDKCGEYSTDGSDSSMQQHPATNTTCGGTSSGTAAAAASTLALTEQQETFCKVEMMLSAPAEQINEPSTDASKRKSRRARKTRVAPRDDGQEASAEHQPPSASTVLDPSSCSGASEEWEKTAQSNEKTQHASLLLLAIAAGLFGSSDQVEDERPNASKKCGVAIMGERQTMRSRQIQTMKIPRECGRARKQMSTQFRGPRRGA